ncbi:restriction endonuclease subunit S [Lacihabitans lacunae]|uniref:Restriction endonuclease subunit S n=1 Tax=Lacihabitans lacunae TaxID=1028214 RepID=A0ABV7Z1F3_9BACT
MTKQTRVPKLRFPEFSENWEVKKLGDIIVNLESGVSVNSTDELISNYGEFGILKTSCVSEGIFQPEQHKKILKNDLRRAKVNPQRDTILISRMNTPQLVGQIGYVFKDYPFLFVPDRLWMARLKSDFNVKLVSFILSSKKQMSKVSNIATGTSGSMKNISQPNYLALEISLPPLPEQNKIANFLTAIDEKIQRLKEKKCLLEEYKKGLMQQIFSQKLRFKQDDGSDFPDWEKKTLGEVLLEHKTRNIRNEIIEVFSVSKAMGVINQIEHLGRSYASDNITNYKVVFPYDLIYTKSPTSDFPFGIIKQNKLNRIGIVSVLYGVFSPKSKYIGLMLDYYFSIWQHTYNYLNPLVQKGAKNTMNIGNKDFLSGSEIYFPSTLNELKKITSFLTSIDEKIGKVSRQIGEAETYKKGLLQQMFV